MKVLRVLDKVLEFVFQTVMIPLAIGACVYLLALIALEVKNAPSQDRLLAPPPVQIPSPKPKLEVIKTPCLQTCLAVPDFVRKRKLADKKTEHAIQKAGFETRWLDRRADELIKSAGNAKRG